MAGPTDPYLRRALDNRIDDGRVKLYTCVHVDMILSADFVECIDSGMFTGLRE